ncbi:MAG: OmpW family outer membrane protein [Bacteroidota bacterium]|nr:OmpW family outer membrane protein [Bacteroidota bacterium]
MRSKFKYSFIAPILFFCVSTARAQVDHELQFNMNYNVNLPAGTFKDFVSNPAYKGFTAGLAYPVSGQFSVGLNVGYNDYYQKYPRQVYADGKGSSISAVVSNSVQQIPVLITASYTLVDKGFIRPYVGAGAGVNFIGFDQYLGEFDNPVSATKLAVRGEAGLLIPLNGYSSTALRIGATYNYAPFNNYGVSNLDNWGIMAGIRFPLR